MANVILAKRCENVSSKGHNHTMRIILQCCNKKNIKKGKIEKANHSYNKLLMDKK